MLLEGLTSLFILGAYSAPVVPTISVRGAEETQIQQSGAVDKSSLSLGGAKEGRNCFLRHFQQLRSYHDDIQTRNWEEILFSSRIVQKVLLVI